MIAWNDMDNLNRKRVWPLSVGMVAGAVCCTVILFLVGPSRVQRWGETLIAALSQGEPDAAPEIDMLSGWKLSDAEPYAARYSDVLLRRNEFTNGYSYVYGFAVDDFDNDGKLDISFADSWTKDQLRLDHSKGSDLYILWNGERQPQRVVKGDVFPFAKSGVDRIYLFERQVAIDLNGDGYKDIVGVVNSHDAVLAYLNPGERGRDWTPRVISSQTPGPVNLIAHDMNGDGRLDLVVTMRYQIDAYPQPSPGIVWLENPGPGTTGEWVKHPIDIFPADQVADLRTLQAADFNGDGKDEILVSDARSGVLAWYSQREEGSWERHEIPDVDVSNAHFGHVKDLNGDGAPDIIAPMIDGLAWLENVDHGKRWIVHRVFTKPDDGPLWQDMFVLSAMAGDIDHDGKDEIVFSMGQLAGGVSAGLYYAKEGQPDEWTVHVISADEQRLANIEVVDYDGDGRLDVVGNAEGKTNSIIIWKNMR
ncbi:FG-GAP repeat domain-containing protein [Bordetella genomosp. 1]|uniref:FG-GAP repeat domain-containing protein n=1 Tax=Bordetella genomosp. 1 TaxID=1395607 RepID=UPI0015C601C0|nr:VCBS repeat-containing protein [Bordetella genomosp. 1]